MSENLLLAVITFYVIHGFLWLKLPRQRNYNPDCRAKNTLKGRNRATESPGKLFLQSIKNSSQPPKRAFLKSGSCFRLVSSGTGSVIQNGWHGRSFIWFSIGSLIHWYKLQPWVLLVLVAPCSAPTVLAKMVHLTAGQRISIYTNSHVGNPALGSLYIDESREETVTLRDMSEDASVGSSKT